MQQTPLEASKWIEVPLLLNPEEMRALLAHLGPLHLFPISRPLTTLDCPFVEEYAAYVAALEKGEQPPPLQAYLMSNNREAFYTDPLADGKFLIRAWLPAIFVRPHTFVFSEMDKKFRSKVYGENAISWGYTFAYPQFCIDPTTHDAAKVDDHYQNTSLFKAIQKWAREHTIPTPFRYNGEKINAPIRIGKGCLHFIDKHPQLKRLNLHVDPS